MQCELPKYSCLILIGENDRGVTFMSYNFIRNSLSKLWGQIDFLRYFNKWIKTCAQLFFLLLKIISLWCKRDYFKYFVCKAANMRLDGSKHFGKLLHVIFPFDDDILLSFACAMELAGINVKIILFTSKMVQLRAVKPLFGLLK